MKQLKITIEQRRPQGGEGQTIYVPIQPHTKGTIRVVCVLQNFSNDGECVLQELTLQQ